MIPVSLVAHFFKMSFNERSCEHHYHTHKEEAAMEILKDLWIIFSEHLGPISFQVRWHLKTFSPVKVYTLFVAREIHADGVYDRLRRNQIEPFIAFHERAKEILAENEFPSALGADLAAIFFENPRQFNFFVAQIDALIERGLLEKGVLQKYGRNFVRREF